MMEQKPSAVVDTVMDSTMEGCLKSWFDCFDTGWARWGLVNYWRDDGTSYERYGIVVTLKTNLEVILTDGLPKLREAIDVAQLVLAVQPRAIQYVLEKREFEWLPPSTFTEEMNAMARGVPVELRLELNADERGLSLLSPPASMELMSALDRRLSTKESFLSVRQELVARLETDTPKLLQLKERVVDTVLRTTPGSSVASSEDAFKAFLDNLSTISDALDDYQRTRGTLQTLATRHVLLVVKEITLCSKCNFFTSRVVDSAIKLLDLGIPVHWFRIQLDPRRVDCDEYQLRKLLEAMVKRYPRIYVETNELSLQMMPGEALDDSGEDHREMITKILRTVGSIHGRVASFDVGGLLKLYEKDHNREAIWRGLFEEVLTPDSQTMNLNVAGITRLQDRDATWVDQFSSEWRASHPDKKLRVKRLSLQLNQSPYSAFRALTTAFDDIEELSLYGLFRFSRDLWGTLLSCPSLRKLRLTKATVSTMDLFTPAFVDKTQPFKPTLEELILEGIELEDVASLRRFYTSLDPSKSTSPLATTLQRLRVTQRDSDTTDPVNGYDAPTLTALNDMLKANQVLKHVVAVDSGDETLQVLWPQLLRHNSVQGPVKWRDTAFAAACNTAFVGAIYASIGDTETTRSRLDASLIRQIIYFNAPPVTRTIAKILKKKKRSPPTGYEGYHM